MEKLVCGDFFLPQPKTAVLNEEAVGYRRFLSGASGALWICWHKVHSEARQSVCMLRNEACCWAGCSLHTPPSDTGASRSVEPVLPSAHISTPFRTNRVVFLVDVGVIHSRQKLWAETTNCFLVVDPPTPVMSEFPILGPASLWCRLFVRFLGRNAWNWL